MFGKLSSRVVDVIKHEPVALWGILAAVVEQVVLPLIHVSILGTEIPVVLTAVGIPVVRSRVSPADAVKEAIKDTEQAIKETSAASPVVPASTPADSFPSPIPTPVAAPAAPATDPAPVAPVIPAAAPTTPVAAPPVTPPAPPAAS